ncbi:efflux RND transporter periplasmic adaptor subunit [Desulfogranum japonicum]|uniref:efflux RND transporter periplasmic adaptor subunit n=1 Tax=Desulfogranum japonicum TaxID=231447 RepID=UPI000401573B|nr:efflux RND transporter periplasmic adaptor subunit [Desulfogranum japonicum]
MGRITQWLAPPLALVVLAGVIFFTVQNMGAHSRQPMPMAEESPQHPDVSVVTVTPGSYNAHISGQGEATPHYSLPLTTEVSGRIENVGNNFESGSILHKGDMLFRIEDTAYTAELATAKSELAESELALLEEERQARQAQLEWESSGLEGEPDSDLVLRIPQLAAARAEVENKKAALELARKNLSKTTVTAPFDCLIVSRDVTPGSYVQAGTEVATLYSIDTMEINIALSASEWGNLPADAVENNHPVTITSVEDGQQTWQGTIGRMENHVDTKTRQRTIIVKVNQPFTQNIPLLAGTFVRVDIPGKELDTLWKLPGSALSQRGEIWFVADNNTLACFQSTPLFSDHDSIYIQVPPALATAAQNVLIHPLSSYVTGMEVRPVKENNDA